MDYVLAQLARGFGNFGVICSLVHARRTAIVALILTGFVTSAPSAWSQTASPPSRPILFVPGYCGDSDSWESLRSYLASELYRKSPTLYPDPNPADRGSIQNYDVYYDGKFVTFSHSQNGSQVQVIESTIQSSARIFTFRFYDPNGGGLNATNAAQVSILNKANELAQVIHEITQVTHIKNVIVVSHSMGGLVARAYLEGLASPSACYDYNGGVHGRPDYSNGLCSPGQTSYAGDIATLITIDAPNGGLSLPLTNIGLLDDINPNCLAGTSTTKTEMLPSSELLSNLNYLQQNIGHANGIPSEVQVQSIESYFSDGNPAWDLIPYETLSTEDDGVVFTSNQSMQMSLPTSFKNGAQFGDWGNPYTVESIEAQAACQFDLPLRGVISGVLHVIACVGSQPFTQGLVYSIVKPITAGTLTSINVQATLDGHPWSGPLTYTVAPETDLQCSTASDCRTATVIPPPPSFVLDWTPGFYTVTGVSGGPSTNMTPAVAFLGQDPVDWNITLTIDFYSTSATPPVVTTQPATLVVANGAIFNGTVNPEGSATNSWFEWGTNASLSQYQKTAQQPLSAGSAPLSVSFDQLGLASNTTYYYRIAAKNGGVTQRGSILQFATAGSPSSPVPSLPANGSTGASTTPTFSWSAVPNATAYLILGATSASALPMDPNSSACAAGCVFSGSPTNATYTLASGALSGNTTYYWEVRATVAGQNGAWSGIFSFTTAPSAGNDFSLVVTPSSQMVNGAGTVGYAVSTTTISGAAQTIQFGVGNLPTGVTPILTPSLITSGGNAIIGLTTSSATPPGTYSVTVAAVGSSTTHTATVTLVVTNNTGAPAVTFSPSILAFGNQTLYTASPPQLVTYTNTGTAPLKVLYIAGDSNFVVQNPCVNTIYPGTSCTFSVVSDPSATGPITGAVTLAFIGSGSPALLPLIGYGIPPSPTTGIIQVNGTLNEIPLPAGYGFDFTLTGPATYNSGGLYTFTVAPGAYTVSYSGGANFTLASVTPSATQTVAARRSHNIYDEFYRAK